MTSDSPTSIDLWYKIDNNLHYFPPGLKQDVQFRSQYDLHDEWKPINEIDFVDTVDVELDEPLVVNFTMRQLEPFTKYTVKIRMLSNVANASDPMMWSSYILGMFLRFSNRMYSKFHFEIHFLPPVRISHLEHFAINPLSIQGEIRQLPVTMYYIDILETGSVTKKCMYDLVKHAVIYIKKINKRNGNLISKNLFIFREKSLTSIDISSYFT